MKVTIHRALSELKLIDAKITKQSNAITNSTVAIRQKDKLIGGVITEEDFAKQAASTYQSAVDLISRKSKIKSAIVMANAVTKVKVGAQEMTIADAITEKGNVAFKKAVIENLKMSYNHATATLNKNNEVVNANVQRLLEATFGKDNVKVGKEDVEAVRKPFVEANEFHLCDPLKAKEKIEALEKEVSDFESEVDAVLSEINAITFVEY